jgi:hypothetical protein
MQRPAANPDNMLPSDFLCDFCGREWDGESPVVEGHRGSLICGDCLAAAYRALVLGGQNSAPEGYECRLCLERRAEIGWVNPAHPEAAACRRCINQSAGVLTKSKDYDWKKPTA